MSVVTGAAGTGKSELLKKLYLEAEAKYKSSLKQVPALNNVQIPIFIRLRECINGNLETLLRDRLNDLDDITDIFSTVLLSENIAQIDDKTTKVDLIKLNAEQRIEKHSNLLSINLPEPKVLSITSILASASEKMQRSGIISIGRSELQDIIRTQFPTCSYLEVDHIINVICELFFDVSPAQDLQSRYSYKHKRYFEFYLYIAVKNVFYDNPSIFRELRLLANRDFVLHIFMIQELKENTLSANLEKVLTLRFFEAYLSDDYLRGEKSPWFSDEKFLVPSSESFSYSSELRSYLCTKQIEDFKDFLRIDPLHTRGFLTSDNYYSFVKVYHKTNGVDIRETLKDFYTISDDQLLKAKDKDAYSYLYCMCVIDNVPVADVYKSITSTELTVRDNDLDYYPTSTNHSDFVIAFFELVVDYFHDWLSSAIDTLSINHLEVLCYILLRVKNLKHIIKNAGELSPLSQTLCNRIAQNESELYKTNTNVLYGVLTGHIIQENSIQARAQKSNTNHYETWRRNIELNSYTLMLLNGKESPYHADYKLGIALRRIIHEYCSERKNEILPAVLTEINRYNLIYKNWFSYNNTCFVGEILSTLDFTDIEIRRFIVELKKFRSVINIFQVLYIVMSKNLPRFKAIANPNIISSEYVEASKDISYYDFNSDLGYQYATMMSQFDLFRADALFENAVNNSIFRPMFRNDDMYTYHLPKSLLIAYDNCWLTDEELEFAIRCTNSMLKLAKETLDSGGYEAFFKYVVEKCCPYLKDVLDDLSTVHSENPNQSIGWESGNTAIMVKDLTPDNLSQYYNCQVDGINYSSRSVWEDLIKFEYSQDKQLSLLYETLENNYYPHNRFSKINKCFPIITAVLLSNTQTRAQAVDFIMKHAGRMGLVNIIEAFAFTGEDMLGKQCFYRLLIMCEAMIYPSSKYIGETITAANKNSRLIREICNSMPNDWNTDDENCLMTYIHDHKVIVRWDSYDEHKPFHEDWATNHPDRNACCVNYYLYYGESLIKRFELVYVDGYRALLPMPNYETKHISRTDYQFSRLVNSSIKMLNEYIARSRLVVD